MLKKYLRNGAKSLVNREDQATVTFGVMRHGYGYGWSRSQNAPNPKTC